MPTVVKMDVTKAVFELQYLPVQNKAAGDKTDTADNYQEGNFFSQFFLRI